VAVPLPASGEIVGRTWLANVELRDTEVSGNHLRFWRAEGRAEIEDVGSRNGTWVDGARIVPKQRVALKDGAVVRLGRSLLVYRASFTGALSPAPPVGRLVGPWGLCSVRAHLTELSRSHERNVLLEGATGTGKELVAAAVINALGRLGKPTASINIAAVPAGVFEVQLFGWVKGAYSGSAEGGEGLLRKNKGGSVFLDEIGELPLDLQPKLLRVLENREVLPVGGTRTVQVDIAVIAATNRPLEEAVERGAFRRDLHARFIERIRLPTLAARPEDVFAILVELAKRRHLDLNASAVEVEAVEHLMLHQWPANVRDLDRVAVAIGTKGQLTLAVVEKVLGARQDAGELTREMAERMVRECDGNEREAERRFGIKRGKLRRALGKAGGGERAP
jgi:transcriptional regulator with PAS, ATPase and Fis domain